ncbi:MAG TPA: carotenoid biosynthesis protein, partial [Opitutae bacterium]|nr:carotenoid biosynthesis protein [Opitutae bacterium]
MNYFEFLMVFVGVPLVIILLIAFRKGKLTQFNISGILVLSLIALVYTTPWDNYLIFRGVWTYPPDAVVGKLGYVPLEEYGFMILQTWLAGVIFALLPFSREITALQFYPLASLPAFFLGALGCFLLMSKSGTYAGLILVWACPPLALQWSLGLKALISTFK